MRPPTVLFDLGNVLVRLDLARGLEHLRRLAGARVPASLAEAAVFFSEASLACNRGALTGEEFLARLHEQLGRPPVARAALAEAWRDIFIPWPEMEALAEAVLAAGHRAVLASNTDPIHFAWLRERIPVLGKLTGLHLSYDAGVNKPDPAFFRGLLERFELAAEACVYLDDRPEHVAAARSVGIRAEVHDGDVARARAFLRASGVAV